MFNTNEYFDGKVKSLAFETAEGPATIGVMAPGTYEFGTSQHEDMTVITGALVIQFPGREEWRTFEAGETFSVEANVKFGVKVEQNTSYLCRYS